MKPGDLAATLPIAPERTMFALAQIGDFRIGVPSANVVQVVPKPARLMKLPRRSLSIEGLFLHAGRLMPVIRLDRWIDLGDSNYDRERTSDERILVLRDASRLIGLLVDTVMGVRRIAATQQIRIHRDDDSSELFQSAAVDSENEGTFSLLEVDRLMHLANVWCDEGGVDVAASSDDVYAKAPLTQALQGRKEAYASFRIGDAYAAVRAVDIGELIPRPPLQHGLPLQSEARGIISWRGRFVPVVDLTHAIGGCVDPQAAPWVCIVRNGSHAVGLLVHEVTALLAADLSTLTKPAAQTTGLILGAIVSQATRTVKLIDTECLMQAFPEVAISANQNLASDLDDRAHTRCTPSAFMVFEAGTPFASPIHSVQEVIKLPPAVLTRMDAGVAVTVEWRGHVVPLIDLRHRSDTNGIVELKQLVIIADGEQRAAVAIGGVRALVPAKAATRRRFPAGSRGMIDMLMVDTMNHQASYAVLDLEQFVGTAI